MFPPYAHTYSLDPGDRPSALRRLTTLGDPAGPRPAAAPRSRLAPPWRRARDTP